MFPQWQARTRHVRVCRTQRVPEKPRPHYRIPTRAPWRAHPRPLHIYCRFATPLANTFASHHYCGASLFPTAVCTVTFAKPKCVLKNINVSSAHKVLKLESGPAPSGCGGWLRNSRSAVAVQHTYVWRRSADLTGSTRLSSPRSPALKLYMIQHEWLFNGFQGHPVPRAAVFARSKTMHTRTGVRPQRQQSLPSHRIAVAQLNVPHWTLHRCRTRAGGDAASWAAAAPETPAPPDAQPHSVQPLAQWQAQPRRAPDRGGSRIDWEAKRRKRLVEDITQVRRMLLCCVRASGRARP